MICSSFISPFPKPLSQLNYRSTASARREVGWRGAREEAFHSPTSLSEITSCLISGLIPSHFPCLVKLSIYRSIDLSMYLSAISSFCLLNSLDSFTYNPTISILRYICIYGTSEPTATSVPASLPCTQLTTWMARNKMAVMLVGYGLLLLLVGLSNSIWFKRMARKYFYKD